VTPRARIALAWAPALLYMALIWVMSSISHIDLPVGSFPLADKGVHAVEYCFLAVLVAYAVRQTFPERHLARTATVSVLIVVSWGVLDELHQAFVPGRSSDVLDIVADAVGGSVGVALHGALHSATKLLRARARATTQAR